MPDFEDVYEQHLTFVWRVLAAMGVPPDRLEDAVQDVFVIVHAKLTGFEGRSRLTTWLYGIARNVALEAIRRQARERQHTAALEEALPPAPGDGEAIARRLEARRLLLDILARLDDDKREVFVLVELEQVPIKEVAAMLGIKENTAWSRLRLARREFDRHAAALRARERRSSG
jgi:RNA polymerase sigma-70 factor (ECF subfamily)